MVISGNLFINLNKHCVQFVVPCVDYCQQLLFEIQTLC
jgi:hypothetical protein